MSVDIGNAEPSTITVDPVAVDDTAQINFGETAVIAVLENDFDPDGDALILDGVGSPVNGNATINGNNILYTPQPTFFGTDFFTYRIIDGNGGTDTATVTVTVEQANLSPIAVDDATQINTGETAVIAVLANDFDPDGDLLTLDGVASPVNGNVAINGDNILYTPQPTFFGTDFFTYTIIDGNGGTDTATVTVNVNTPPFLITSTRPIGTPKVDFLELNNGTIDWFVTISPNSLAGETIGEETFEVDGIPQNIAHGTGGTFITIVSDSDAPFGSPTITISIQPPSELSLNDTQISQGSFNLSSITGFLSDETSISIATPDPILATIGDTMEHILFDAPLNTEVLQLTGFFDPSNPDISPANFNITLGPLSGAGLQWTFYLPATTDMTSFQVTDLNTTNGLGDNTNYFLI